MRVILSFAVFSFVGVCSAQVAKLDATNLKINFDHYTCRDKFGRQIHFYLSPAKGRENLPLAVLVSGSGGQSMWVPRGDKVLGGLQNLLERKVQGKMRVLAVEKPGVPFGFQENQPGTAIGATEEFAREHTLERWTEAVNSAIKAAHKLPGIDNTRTLAVGHSEGGIVVCKLAALNKSITHVAVLAGGGPTQLFEFFKFFGKDQTLQQWDEIRKDPMSSTKMAWGHPFRRWSTFLETSPVEQALLSKAKFYIAQGSEDKSTFPESAQILFATLVSRGRPVKLNWIDGGDHGFEKVGEEPPGVGFERVFKDLAQWCAQDSGS